MWTNSYMGSIQECFHVALPGNPPAVRRGETLGGRTVLSRKNPRPDQPLYVPEPDAATVGDGRPTMSWSSITLKKFYTIEYIVLMSHT
jgi:hypothetical protein